MSTHPSAYEDLATPAEMHADCCATDEALHLVGVARRAAGPAPSLHFEDQPRERPKPEIEISAATARLAAAVYGD